MASVKSSTVLGCFLPDELFPKAGSLFFLPLVSPLTFFFEASVSFFGLGCLGFFCFFFVCCYEANDSSLILLLMVDGSN